MDMATLARAGVGRARARRPRVVVAAVALICVAGAFVCWRVWSSRAVAGVHVTWDGDPVCHGTELRPRSRAIEWTPEMSCVITVAVRNDGPATVRITDIVLPFVGPGGGAVVVAAPVAGFTPATGPHHDIDASLALDHRVEPGTTWTFPTRLVFRSDGCTDAGTFGVPHWPRVTVSARGRGVEIPSEQRLTIHSRHQNPGCRMEN